jgi:hypothetical protein
MDEHTDALVARAREVQRVGGRSDSPPDLGNRECLVVGALEGGEELRREAGSTGNHF